MKTLKTAILLGFFLLSHTLSVSAADNIYEVSSTDTLPSIAEEFNISVEELLHINGLQSEELVVGQKIKIPILYEVQAGDSIQEIAQAYHSTVEKIKTTNGLSSESVIPGQLLHVVPKKLPRDGQHIVMSKEEFKDWLFHQEFKREIKLIQHHHTWAPSYKHFNGSNHFQILKGMERHHKKEMGWSNIAQNITTFPDGKIAVSRPFDVAPEGTIGPLANANGLTIENLGNFDVGHDTMTKEQKETIIYITALLSVKFGLTPSIDTITYHHWWRYKTGERLLDEGKSYEVKSCPGTGFFGGNSTVDAKQNLYPLVKQKMDEILQKYQ
ncbi:LysM peptidoglycan-binding domain-containing protein [Ornithinibacillus halophilus]|uniref:LysM domain-containing protein n=1 Tax=Ornithinibacillus halophilus TaxID=930117 RepID=A0A1M5G462_9BACI|nr:LysM peptidoglycan-binding domain-containing protein [Ornithinibacillus halophilus]SHF98513.1 LysM domain-containing protein [Ornithinibacillus halophilus]